MGCLSPDGRRDCQRCRAGGGEVIITPVWLTPNDVVASLAAYEHNGEFRIWLSAISKLKTKGLASIERLSSLLIRDVPSKALGNAVDRFLRMREVHWWYLHHEWMRKS